MQTFANSDSGGFDFAHVPGKSVEEMYKICLACPYAVGFNSHGWLKYHISETKSQCQGSTLYVLSKPFRQLTCSNLPPIWCINLQRREDRKKIMKEREWSLLSEMKGSGSTNAELIHFFQAVDGSQLTMTEEIKHLFRGNDFGFRRGVVGAALSHYNLWRQLLASENGGYLIIEDDIEFSKDFMAKYSHAMAQVQSLDPDWDFLYLGFSLYERKRFEGMLWNEKYPLVTPFDTKLCFGAGFFGYVISCRGAKKLINYIGENGINRAIDCLPPVIQGIRRYSCFPNIIQTPCFGPGMENVDTDIQKDYNVLL